MKEKINYQKITKKFTKTFYYSTLFFPKKIRDKIFLLYSFVRIIDNFVDKKNPAKEKFYFYKNELLNFLNKNKISKLKIVNDIGDLIKKENLKKEILDYLKTQEKELAIKKYKTIKDFENFIYGTAGTIGIMMAKILKLPSKTYLKAKKLGQSLQIINIVRDLKEDYQRKKIYLPEELLKKYQLNYQNFLSKKNREKLYQLLKDLIKKAFILENQVKKSYIFFPKKIFLPIKIAVDLYQQIAKKIYKNPQLIFNKKKLKPNFFEIIKIIIKNYFLIYGLNKRK